MRRLFAFLLRIAIVIAVVVGLANQPGTARVIWHGYRIETSASILGLCVVALGFVFYGLFRLWHLLRHGPEMWRLNRKLKKIQQGHDFLTQGLVAVAGGHAADAGRLALAARRKLGTTTATLLLQAQAAQLAHDHRTARALFRAMIEDEESAVLGYRGLIMEARRTGEWGEVERLSAEVARLKPDMPWLDWIRFETAARALDWNRASEALARLKPTRLLDADVQRRHQAALLIAQSQQAAERRDVAAALEFAEASVKQMPEWLPALINLAEQQACGDYHRAVRRTVEKAWAIQPQPQLAEILASTEEAPIARYQRIEKLCRGIHDASAQNVVAEAALDADIWGEARRHLLLLVNSNQATQKTYQLLARLERRENGDDRKMVEWLKQAAEAVPDPAWLCSACGGSHPHWTATCRSCGAFATLEWRQPGARYASVTNHTPLLSD